MTDDKLIEDAARYAEGLALSLHAKWFASKVPNWKPLSGDLIGLLTQIDNMTCGIAPAVRETCAAENTHLKAALMLIVSMEPAPMTLAHDMAKIAQDTLAALPLDGLARSADHFADAGKMVAAPAPDMVLAPPLPRPDYCKPHEFVLICSYCGDETDGCTEKTPCADCLAMCNVFGEDGAYLRQLGAATPAPQQGDETP